MEITQKLYKELFNRAMSYSYRNEDVAAEAVIHLYNKLPKYSGTCELQFWAFANPTLKNKCYDLYQKKKYQMAYIDEINADTEDLIENDDMYQQIKDKLTQDEYDYAIAYYSVDHTVRNKTLQERLKMKHIREKVLKEKIEQSYILVDPETGNKFKYETFKEIGEKYGMSTEAVRLVYKDGRKIKKRYFFEKS